MPDYLFKNLPPNSLFISASRIINEGSLIEFILEKISDTEAIYRDDTGKIKQTVKIPADEPVIRVSFVPSYPHHNHGPPLPYS